MQAVAQISTDILNVFIGVVTIRDLHNDGLRVVLICICSVTLTLIMIRGLHAHLEAQRYLVCLVALRVSRLRPSDMDVAAKLGNDPLACCEAYILCHADRVCIQFSTVDRFDPFKELLQLFGLLDAVVATRVSCSDHDGEDFSLVFVPRSQRQASILGEGQCNFH